VAFADLLPGDEAELEKYFGERVRGLNRYAKLIEEAGRRSEITEVRNRSVELVVGGLTLLATIVVPIAVLKAQRQLQQEDLEVVFEIDPDDATLRRKRPF